MMASDKDIKEEAVIPVLDSDYSSDDAEELEVEDSDLRTTIEKEIREETYVCLVCTGEIDYTEEFWSCGDCYRVYHISCISSWSTKGSSTDEEGNWKCPACHSTHARTKFQDKCWCSKTINPQPNQLHPGSCGQTCGAQLPGCPHKCPLACHPGPHAQCNALGPLLKCKCGKHENQWPCVITPYIEGWQCDEICQEFLPCELHKCGKKCHAGLCGKCETFVSSRCYCGQSTDMLKCHLRMPKLSFGERREDNWVGDFQCKLTKDVTYDCGLHSTSIACQPVPKRKLHCPQSPDILKTCPCGQTSILELNNGVNRQCCTDPIPTCDKLCNKTLPCGHRCKWKCHDGECSPCLEILKQKCRCGFNSFNVPCKFISQGFEATCTRQCTVLLSCRRHRCEKICCPDESSGLARERQRKKSLRNNQVTSRNANSAFNVEAGHICLRTCNKKLSCGNPDHVCHDTCHAGPCRPCLESTNDDLVCNCGKTVVMAPVRCGTTLPPCDHPCIRPTPCGHPPMPHNCHPDSVECPKCTYTVMKECNCSRKIKRSAMCHQKDVFCGNKCDHKLPCGHTCLMLCHKGPCVCKSFCGRKKKYCSHVDRTPCHYPEPCKLEDVCAEPTQVKCRCGRMTKTVPCGASVDKESVAGTPISCDVSCVLKERDERLKSAFNITSNSAESDMANVPYSDEVLKIASVQEKWCLQVEGIMREFMSNERRSMSFKPMRREQRAFVHELAECFGLFSESQDPEPKRSVFVSKKPNSASPEMSLAQGIRRFQAHKRATTKIPLKVESTKKNLNAILIQDCIEGTTRDMVDDVVRPLFGESDMLYSIQAVNKTKYLVVPEAFMRSSDDKEEKLQQVALKLSTICREMFISNVVKMVRINIDYDIVREESVESISNESSSKESIEESDEGNNEKANAFSETLDKDFSEMAISS